jgi:thiol-disulfide isomerase/thioredoxin
MSLRLFFGVVLLLVLLGLGFCIKHYYEAPDFSTQWLHYYKRNNIKAHALDLKRPLLLVFAASWCGTCREELLLMNRFAALDSTCVLVLSDEHWTKINRLKELAPRLQYGKTLVPFSKLKIHAIPCAYIIGPGGQWIKKHDGEILWNDPSTRNYFFTLLNLQCP